MDEVLVTGLEKLIGFLESASPELWRILVKQAYVVGIQWIVGLISCVICVIVCRRVIHHLGTDECKLDSVDTDVTRMVTAIFMVIAIVLGVASLISAVGVLANPEYHAIRGIMSVLR